MKYYRNFGLFLLIAIVWICSSFVQSAPTNEPGYMWCGDLVDGRSEEDNIVNKESLADTNAELAPGSYELVGVLS